jgi:hypothetical protein
MVATQSLYLIFRSKEIYYNYAYEIQMIISVCTDFI